MDPGTIIIVVKVVKVGFKVVGKIVHSIWNEIECVYFTVHIKYYKVNNVQIVTLRHEWHDNLI